MSKENLTPDEMVQEMRWMMQLIEAQSARIKELEGKLAPYDKLTEIYNKHNNVTPTGPSAPPPFVPVPIKIEEEKPMIATSEQKIINNIMEACDAGYTKKTGRRGRKPGTKNDKKANTNYFTETYQGPALPTSPYEDFAKAMARECSTCVFGKVCAGSDSGYECMESLALKCKPGIRGLRYVARVAGVDY